MTSAAYVGRAAPSPTGDLHMGNLFATACAYARARRAGGRFVLRIEDVDTPRTVLGAAQRIEEDLATFGFVFDAGPSRDDGRGPYVQSSSTARYEAALAALRARGLVYACRCSRKDLREASAPHGEDGPIYPGTCRALDLPFDDPALPVAWRFRAPEGAIVVDDALAGRFAHDVARDVGDFIVKRRDGLYAYQLAVVVDDAHQGVTEIVRGRDLLQSAPRQVALFRALGRAPPGFAHVPLVVDASGARLSKRRGDETVRARLARGEDSHALLGALAHAVGRAARGSRVSLEELCALLDDDALRVESIALA